MCQQFISLILLELRCKFIMSVCCLHERTPGNKLPLNKFNDTVIPQVTALQFTDILNCHHSLKLQLFSGMMLLPGWLPTAGVTVFSLFTNMVSFASLCVIVLHSVIK